MDYENLIEHLRMHLGTYKKDFENFNCGMCALDCANAATAIETLRADLARVTAERDAAIKDLNEFLSLDELCPIQCEWCKWKDTFCDGKTPEWRGIQKED